MNLDEAIERKKVELEEMQKDIDSLETQAAALKETVKKYNSLKKQSSIIKKQKVEKESEFSTVVNFFSSLGDSYIEQKYPLLAQILINKPAEQSAAIQIN